MKTYLIVLLPVICLVACGPKHEHKLIQDGDFQNCYRYLHAGDKILLRLNNYDGYAITGELVYALKEKDVNRGTITGEMKGDTLFAVYNYSSEGITGKRNIAFLKSGDAFIQGTAKLDPKTGETDFSDHSKITFKTSGLKLDRTECRN